LREEKTKKTFNNLNQKWSTYFRTRQTPPK